MRPFLLSLAFALTLGAAWAQVPAGAGGGATANSPQIPFGQTYKDFQFPQYQNGQLNSMLSAVTATGVTMNRADTTQLKIQLYTNGKVTTTITSPRADLYVAERKMRTKNTVQIDRTDSLTTAQTCDFDLMTKKYLLRENVKVILKNFDVGSKPKGTAASGAPATAAGKNPPPAPVPAPASDDDAAPMSLHSGTARNDDSLLDMPGAYANTNTAPIPPPKPVTP